MLYLNLFNRGYIERSYVKGVYVPRYLDYLKKLYVFNTEQIVSYYNQRNFAVKNTHLLSRLTEQFELHPGYDDYRYMSYACEKAESIVRHFMLTHDHNRGIIQHNTIFPNSNEILIANTDYTSPKVAIANWKTSKILTAHKLDKSNLQLLLPTSRDDGGNSSFNVISINLPLLAIAYREYVKEQSKSENPIYSKNVFVMKYVLPSIVDDLVDFTILNRLINRFYNRDNETVKFKHRFKIFMPETQLNRFIDDTLDIITSKKLNVMEIMFNILLMNKINMAELMMLPELSGNRQTRWAMFLMRLEYMVFLYDACKYKETSKHFFNDWKVLVTKMERDRDFKSEFERLDYDRAKDYKEKMYMLKNI